MYALVAGASIRSGFNVIFSIGICIVFQPKASSRCPAYMCEYVTWILEKWLLKMDLLQPEIDVWKPVFQATTEHCFLIDQKSFWSKMFLIDQKSFWWIDLLQPEIDVWKPVFQATTEHGFEGTCLLADEVFKQLLLSPKLPFLHSKWPIESPKHVFWIAKYSFSNMKCLFWNPNQPCRSLSFVGCFWSLLSCFSAWPRPGSQ